MTQPTYASRLTAPGQSAVAVIGVFGPSAWSVVQELFRRRSGQPLSLPPARGRPILGRFGSDIADEVVLVLKQLVPVPWLELHTHGGDEACRFARDLLIERGVVECSWQQFLAHVTGDRLKALAAAELAAAPTVRTAAILLDQYHGAFANAIDAVIADLDRGENALAGEGMNEIARFTDLGRHLHEPWRVVVTGPPNVGKSTLINALAGYERCVVSPRAGTTRDVVATRTAIDGWPVELVDTAGLRLDAGALEAQGMALARQAIASADLCLWVTDAREPVPGEARSLPARHRLILNKIDELAELRNDQPDAIRISAKSGVGISSLVAAIATELVPNAPPRGVAIPFTAALCDGIEQAARLQAQTRTAEARRVLANLRAGIG